MTDETEAPNKLTAVLESFGTRGLGRMQVVFSVPLTEIGSLLPFLARNLKSPVDLTFAAVQASLFDEDDEDETEETTMSVDGQDGQNVRRPRRNGLHADAPFENLGEVSDAAAKLISDSRTTPATEAEAQEQADAMASLARKD